MKVWLLAESKTGYIVNYIVYTGKLSEENMDSELEGHNQGYKVVMALIKPYLNLGHNVYFDNLFTSLRMWDMSTLIRRCEIFGHFHSFISRLLEASERQTMA